MLGATDPSTADLLRGIDQTGARPHELAGAVVSDFDGTALRLAHRKGRPPNLRVRYVLLGPEGVDFFASLVDGKARAAIDRHNDSAKEGEVKIPEAASAYSLRHARISELLQIHGIDPISVASQTTTAKCVWVGL